MTAKDLARAVWPYINDKKRQRAVIAMDEGRVFTYIPEGMDYRLIAQNFTHALMAILEGGDGYKEGYGDGHISPRS